VVARAIASVAAQTYQDIELVVVDDGSTDASATVVAQSLAGLPFPARLIRNPHRGAAFAANAGAEAAHGRYLALLSADDYFAPDYVQQMVQEVGRATPLWGYAYTTDFGLPQAAPALGGSPVAAALPKPRDFLPGSFTLLSKNAAEANGNLFVERDFFLQLGGYRDFGQHRGWDFAVRATEQVEGVAVDRPLYFHNVANPNRQPIPPHLGPRALIADALNRVNTVPNEFAPQFTGNRELLLRSEFRGGYTTRVAPAMLRAVAENLRAALPVAGATARNIPGTKAADRIALVVLGFYRSGTSAFTRVLNLCGAALPEQLMASRLGVNPKGFWETEEINDLDARLLGHLGGDWDRVDFDIPTTGPLIDEFRVDARELLAREYGDASFILIKDPRICIMGPLWRQVLLENGYRPVYVVPVRNPLEVARSIHARGDMPVAKALALWLTYMQRAETFVTSDGIAAVHVRYAELLADWRGVVQRIARRLAVPLPIDRNAGEIDQFLEAGMHNQQASDAELEAHLSGPTGDAIRALYRRSLERCVQDAVDSAG
jgi:glycosyltransferase involved in cell wall biosynthesis